MTAITVAGRDERMDRLGIFAAIASLLGGGGLAGTLGAWYAKGKPKAEVHDIEASSLRADFVVITGEWQAQLAEVKAERTADRQAFAAQQAEFAAERAESEERHRECQANLTAVSTRLAAAEARITELGG